MGHEIQFIHHFSHWVQQKFHKEVSVERIRQVELDSTDKQNDLVLPVIYNDMWLSQVRIKSGQFLDRFAQHQISHFVELQLAPALYKQMLDLQIHNLRSLAAQSFETSDLHLLGGPLESEESYYESRSLQTSKYKEPLTICLYGRDVFRHRKIANEVHHLFKQRWAFINYRDISSDITRVEQIFDLGAVTLYIDQPHTLSQCEIDLLRQFITKKQSDLRARGETPLLILSNETKEEFSSLLDETTLDVNQDFCLRTENWPLQTEQIRDILDLLLA